MPLNRWFRSFSNAFIDGSNRLLVPGPVLSQGDIAARARLHYIAQNSLGTDDQAAPTSSPWPLVGLRWGDDTSTPPVTDVLQAPNAVDWWFVWTNPPYVVPRSTVNGWDLYTSTSDPAERIVNRVCPPTGRQAWAISTPLPAGGIFPWGVAGFLEVLTYTP